MTIHGKLVLLVSLIGLLVGISFFAISEVAKGSRFHYYNYLHATYADDLANYLDETLGNGGVAALDTTTLRRMVTDIRAQPVACLDEVHILDVATLKLSGHYGIIELCKIDIALADKTLQSLSDYESGRLAPAIFTTRLLEAKDDFERNSKEFGPGVRDAVDFVGLFMRSMLFLTALVVGGWALLFARSMAGTLRSMIGAINPIAAGDYSVEVPGRDRSDEIGDMARVIHAMKETGEEARQLATERKLAEERHLAEEEARRAERNAERERQIEAERAANEAKAARQRRMDELAARFDQEMSAKLTAVANETTQLHATAKGMSEIARRTADESETVAEAAAEASANVDSVAAANEELSRSIAEMAQQAAQSLEIARATVEKAQNTDVAFRTLADQAQTIGDVIGLIRDIAEQTNLLALNATIEAARAGEAGKGFAVVASEVKALAAQTAKATQEIGEQVAGVQKSTGSAVHAIQDIGIFIEKLNQTMSSIAQVVEEHRAVTEEISSNMQSAAGGTNKVTEIIAGTNDSAVETGRAAEEVLRATEELSKQCESLSSEIQDFLTAIKAA